jgi:hypothetical protein
MSKIKYKTTSLKMSSCIDDLALSMLTGCDIIKQGLSDGPFQRSHNNAWSKARHEEF